MSRHDNARLSVSTRIPLMIGLCNTTPGGGFYSTPAHSVRDAEKEKIDKALQSDMFLALYVGSLGGDWSWLLINEIKEQ